MTSTLRKNTKRSGLRLLIVGRTGHGKSSTCNTISGRTTFKVSAASTSETKTCEWQKVLGRFGRDLEIVDTPGIFDTDVKNSKVHKELIKSLLLTTPGFHAIAFVLMRGKFTEEIQKTKDIFFEWFGKDVVRYSFVILTDTNTLQEKNEFLRDRPHPKLTELVKECDERVVPLQNKGGDYRLRDKQTSDIVRMVEHIQAKNKNDCFSNVAFKLAESYAKHKGHLSLSRDSLRLLSSAGLSLTRIQNGSIQCILEEGSEMERTDNDDGGDGKGSGCEDTKSKLTRSAPNRAGNLKIFDDVTDEPLHDTRNTNTLSEELNPVCSYKTKEKGRPRSREGRVIDPDSFQATPFSPEVSDDDADIDEIQIDEQHLFARNNDETDTRYQKDSDILESVEIMKNNVNSETDDVEIKGFIGFVRRALHRLSCIII